MTEVFTSLFGRKKAKGPAPAPPPTNHEDFVVVSNSPNLNNTSTSSLYPSATDNESGDYESLFSFLRVQPNEMGASRPARPAPPVPAPRGFAGPQTYGLTPSSCAGGAPQTSSESQASSFYISGIPFQISKSIGGGVNAEQMKIELNDILSRVRAPNLAEYEYPFILEEQVLREISANKNVDSGQR